MASKVSAKVQLTSALLSALFAGPATMLPETPLPKTTYPTKRGGFRIGTSAMLVTAWLSTGTSGAFGADPRALTTRPESRGLTSHAPESQTLRVRVDEGLFSLQAIQRPYIEVLDAIRKETGIRFHYSIPMAGAVTLSFKDLPVQEALKRILGSEAQLMFRFPPEPGATSRAGVPEDVWILGKVSGPIAKAGGPIESGPANGSLSSVAEGAVTAAQSWETPAPWNEAQPEVAQTTNAHSEDRFAHRIGRVRGPSPAPAGRFGPCLEPPG